MDQVPPYPLWLGHIGEARDFPRLFETGIKAVVQLSIEEPPLQTPRELIYCRFPLLDGMGNPAEWIALATETTARLIRLRVPTLVCCGLGMSRSPSIAAAALALDGGGTPEACLSRVLRNRRGDVSPALWNEVVAFLSSARSNVTPHPLA